jgi:hypothetical protein
MVAERQSRFDITGGPAERRQPRAASAPRLAQRLHRNARLRDRGNTIVATIKPTLRATETYTESNFLRLHTRSAPGAERAVTIEHMSYRARQAGRAGGWSCQSVVDGELMSRDDALFIARSYAERMHVPVIYECHED